MRVACEIDNIKTLKRGMKITLSIGDKEVSDVMKNIYRFHRKICLCRAHHSEAHTIGANAFEDKYHVYGVIWNG